MHSHNNGLGHRDHGLSANVITQPFEFPAVKPHTITLGALVYDNPMSDLLFRSKCIQRALANIFICGIQN
jgi:hypothetical protein